MPLQHTRAEYAPQAVSDRQPTKDRFDRWGWYRKVRADKIPLSAKNLASGLSEFVNKDDGTAFPSIKELAEKCGQSQAWVRKTIPILVATGWVDVEIGKPGWPGQGHSNRYQINLQKRAVATVATAKKKKRKGDFLRERLGRNIAGRGYTGTSDASLQGHTGCPSEEGPQGHTGCAYDVCPEPHISNPIREPSASAWGALASIFGDPDLNGTAHAKFHQLAELIESSTIFAAAKSYAETMKDESPFGWLSLDEWLDEQLAKAKKPTSIAKPDSFYVRQAM